MVRRKTSGEIHLHSCDLMKMTRFVWIFSSVSLLFVAVLYSAPLLYLALLLSRLSWKRANFCREITLHAFLTSNRQRESIYISLSLSFSSWKTRQHLCGFSSRTTLHICTRRLEFFYFLRFVPRNDFPPLNERVNFARDALFAYHWALPGFFCSRTIETRDCLTPFQTRIFEPVPHDRPLLYLSHSLESRDATLIHFFFESFLTAYAFHSPRPTARACLSFTNCFNSFDFANASVFLRFSKGKGRKKKEKKKINKKGTLDSNAPTATTLTTR